MLIRELVEGLHVLCLAMVPRVVYRVRAEAMAEGKMEMLIVTDSVDVMSRC
jgi:hypothetical protein